MGRRCIWCDQLIAEGVVCSSCKEAECAYCPKCGHGEFLWSKCHDSECPSIEVCETKTTPQIIAEMKEKAAKGKWNSSEIADLEERKRMKGSKK